MNKSINFFKKKHINPQLEFILKFIWNLNLLEH